jgi:hypothetical protein
VAFHERAKQKLAAKRALAAAAYALLAPHSTIFLDAGTTVLQLARLIRVNPLPLRVFTNGLLIAQEFLNVPNLQVSVLGGQLRSENASFVGPQAEAALNDLWFDRLFLGAGCIGPDGAIYSADSAEASLNRHMLPRAAMYPVDRPFVRQRLQIAPYRRERGADRLRERLDGGKAVRIELAANGLQPLDLGGGLEAPRLHARPLKSIITQLAIIIDLGQS